MSCVLRIEGTEFRVDDFLKSTGLKPYKIFRKNEKDKIVKDLIYDSNGCAIDLSKADFDEFEQQKKDVIAYLKMNFEKLNTVFSFGLHNDEIPVMDFGTTTRMHEVEIQSDYLEPELLKLAGNLNFGIELSQYHPAIEHDDLE